MNHIKRFAQALLAIILLIGAFPMTGTAASTETWPGYPAVDQLPEINTIPDPFKFFDTQNDPSGDGYVSSTAEWTDRRDEIKDLVQRYWLGYRWPTEASSVTGATYQMTEANEISVGFDWPPIFTATKINLRDEFDELSEKLKTDAVNIHEIIPPAAPFGPYTLGDVVSTFGPVSDSEDVEAAAVQTAIQAWNAGYYVPYTSFGAANFAVLKDYAGELSAPPAETKQVTYNSVTITNPDNNAEASFHISVDMPTAEQKAAVWGDVNAQVPVIIDIGGAVSQVAAVKEQGYAYIRFTPTDIYPDDSQANDGINRNGVYTKLYPYNKDVYEYASGALMAWGWGASQIISALEQPADGSEQTWGEQLRIDSTKTLVTGHSRYGKAAMFAAAFDDRFDICLASEPGGSGIQSYRYKVEGKIFNFNVYPKADRVYGKTEIPTVSYGGGNSWFPETAGQFVNHDNKLPFDSSDIISLVAPRPFFATTGIDAHWLGNEGAVAAVQAASEVYAYIGQDDIEKSNAVVRARESNHVLYNRDLAFVFAIMDREFKQTDDDKVLHVKDVFPNGEPSLGNISYPAKDYNGISEMNAYPFDINSSYLPWSSPDKYTLWTAQENFLVGYPVTITAHSNAPDVKLILPDGTEFGASSHNGEQFSFHLTADQAVYGRYELRTIGDEKLTRSVFFAAVSLADALRHATSKGDEGEENRLIGFSSRLANNADNPPVVYIDGEPTTMSFTPERFKTEETTLLEYGILFHDPLFARIANEGWDESKTFDIKNLNFVTIPGFTFEISFGNIYASAVNSGKDGAARFTQPISWNVERYNNGPAEVWPVIPDTKAEKDILLAGGTVTRPDAPAPKPTAFDTEITRTMVQRAGDKTQVVIDFNEALDSREFGFGVNVTDQWETVWSEDKKRVTLSFDYDHFPEGSNASIIIFRLKDTEGNVIPGPEYLTLHHKRTGTSSPVTNPLPPVGVTDPDGDSIITMQPSLNGSTGLIKLDGAKADEWLAEGITIIVSELEDAIEYAIGIPTAAIANGKGEQSLTVSTAFGAITIPDNMLALLSENSSKEAVITIGEGDKDGLSSKLKSEIGDRPLIQLSLSIDGKQIDWRNPGAPVNVSIPYIPTEAELANPEHLVIWYIDGNGNAVAVPNARYDDETGSVHFKTTHFSLYAVAFADSDIQDIDNVAWAQNAIEVLAAKEIMKLFSGDAFRPNESITRADFLYGLVRALDLNTETEGNFEDVSEGVYYYNEIAAAKKLGITRGTGDNRFMPDTTISRQDMMVMTERALKLLGKLEQQGNASVLDKFTDESDIASYAVNSAAALVKEGLIIGNNNKIMPLQNTTRAEAAVFLYRIYNQ